MTETLLPQIVLGLGSNLGDRMAALQAAIDGMAPFVTVTAISPVYETAPAYVIDQPAFLNAVITGTTRLEPLALLWNVKDLESDIGRGPVYRHGPRMIDIDIIFYGDLIMKTTELTIPHTLMTKRDFILRPLNDIAPDIRHPQNGKSVAELWAQLFDTGMARLDDTLSLPSA